MSIYSAAIILFLVLDPLGNVPVFIAALRHVPEARRRIVLARELVIALIVLAAFLFFGRYVLAGMHISEPALSIGGGVVLFLIAVRMIFPPATADGFAEVRDEEPLIVPLAVPLVAGPSAMATLILFATQYPDRLVDWLIALVAAWFASSVILFSADILRRRLSRGFLVAVERLMGMILITMAVQMLLSGIALFIAYDVLV